MQALHRCVLIVCGSHEARRDLQLHLTRQWFAENVRFCIVVDAETLRSPEFVVLVLAPSMTEEDQHGDNLPNRYRFDSCKAVVCHLNEALTRQQPKIQRLQEWEAQNVCEETCSFDFVGYGIRLVNGENAFSGPGLKRTESQAGIGAIRMGGDTWQKRVSDLSRKFGSDNLGEDDLYEYFWRTGRVSDELCFKESGDCQLGSVVSEKAKVANLAGRSPEKKQRVEKKQKVSMRTKRLRSVSNVWETVRRWSHWS